MTKLKPKNKFYTKASYLLSRNTPANVIYDLVLEYEITKEEIDRYFETTRKSKAISSALVSSKDEQEIVYNHLDSKFIEENPHVVTLRYGDNIFFHEYINGVYVAVSDKDMYNRVDELMACYALFDYRTSKRKVLDTITRIEALLSRTPKRNFKDSDIYRAKWYLNLKNGLLDVETFALLPHTPDYFSTSQTPFPFEPGVECPLFEEFIQTVSNQTLSATQMIQEMFGYCILSGNPKHKVFYLYGDIARNGKSTTAKILCGLIGWGNVSTLSLAQIAGEKSSILMSLLGKQLNFSDEVSSKYVDSSRLTSMSSEGVVEIDPKFKTSFLHVVKAKFIIACNDLPVFKESQGMKHRMISIPFSYHIPEKDRIDRYDEILLGKEGTGILNWAIAGAKILKESKMFSINEESAEDMSDNTHQSNSVYAFLEMEYTFDKAYTKNNDPTELYGEYDVKNNVGTGYRWFCQRKGVFPKSEFNFKKELKRFARETGKIEQVRVQNERYYVGLTPKKLAITDDVFENI